ncbi:MAG: NERD domain-containing protein kinase family protein [Planctomycetota bacterium]
MVCNMREFSCEQERTICRMLLDLEEGFLAHNILMQDSARPVFPNEHDIVLLVPWAAYTIESKRVKFKYVNLPGNSPAEWADQRPMWGRSPRKAVYLPGRENPLHTAWKKAQILRSHYIKKKLKEYPVYGLVVFPDWTIIESGDREDVLGLRACNIGRLMTLLEADRAAHRDRLYDVSSLRTVFEELEALPAELEPPYTIERLEFLRRREAYSEPGCPVPVDCYEGRDMVTGFDAEIRVYDTRRISEDTERFFRRVRRRMQALTVAADPNVIQVLTMARWPDADVVAYQAYKGESLRQAVRLRGRLDIPLAFTVIFHLASTVERLHSRPKPVMHLDIRPEHVLVAEGLESHEGKEHVLSGLTNPQLSDEVLTATVYKEPFDASFVAPGLREGLPGEKRDPRNDIYSLGAVLAYCIMGERQYLDALGLANGIVVKIAPATGSRDIDRFIETATHPRKELRHRNVQEFLNTLNALRLMFRAA